VRRRRGAAAALLERDVSNGNVIGNRHLSGMPAVRNRWI
jgi:hypothetical protein